VNVELFRVDAGANEVAVLEYSARRPRGVTLVVGHGYSSSKQNLDMLCAFLASHGFAVYSLDFPGHKLGSSGGRLNAATDLIDAMSAVVRVARERGAGDLYVVGHSMGAVTALCAAGFDGTITGAVSIATGYGRPQALETLARGGVVDLRSSYVVGLALPELAGQWQPLLDDALPRLAGRPTLFIAAERDGMVSRASVDLLFARAPEPKSFATIASDHTFAGDNARATVLAWLNERHPRDGAPQRELPLAVDAPL
jgi:pimeloyl-ACP methyl ester carboxylesterase